MPYKAVITVTLERVGQSVGRGVYVCERRVWVDVVCVGGLCVVGV